MRHIRRWWEVRASHSATPSLLRLSVPTRLRVRVDGRDRQLQVFVLDPTLAAGETWREVVSIRHAGAASSRTLDCDPAAILAELRRSISNEQTFVPAYRFLDEDFAQRWAGVGHEIAIHERMVGLPQPFGVVSSVTSAAMTAMTLEINEPSVALCAQAVLRDSYSSTRVRFQHDSAGPHIDVGYYRPDGRLSIVRDRENSAESIRRWVGLFPFDADERQRWIDDLTRAAFFGDARFAHGVIEATRAVVEFGDRSVVEALSPAAV